MYRYFLLFFLFLPRYTSANENQYCYNLAQKDNLSYLFAGVGLTVFGALAKTASYVVPECSVATAFCQFLNYGSDASFVGGAAFFLRFARTRALRIEREGRSRLPIIMPPVDDYTISRELVQPSEA